MKRLIVYLNLIIGLIVNLNGQTITYLSATPDPSHPLDYSKAVGSLPGSVGVNGIGAATYSIPIDLPPGTAGITPQLSLQYNSMSGNGIMGIGWNIGEISTISRVGQDRFNEGDYTAVNYTSSDRLTMNGQRLILKSGTWFSTGSQYRTQNESYNQITYNGTYFIVLTPNGDSIYYGAASESRLKLEPPKVLAWYISKIADAFGNSIAYTYRYITGSNEVLIDKIEYTKTKNFPAYNKVQFNYEIGRTDYLKSYHAGIKFDGDYILKGIDIYANSVLTKNLTFRYLKNSNKDTYLSYIEHSGKNGLKTNTTQFNWINSPVIGFTKKEYVLRESTVNLTSKTPFEIIELVGECNKMYHTILDVDGDGKSDVITVNPYYHNIKQLTLRYNNFESSKSWTLPSGYSGFIPIDYNGDGKEELLLHKGVSSPIPHGFQSKTNLSYYGADSIFGGNSQFSLVNFSNGAFVAVTTSNNYGITGLENLMYDLLQGDLDGNGMTDLIFFILRDIGYFL